MIKALNAGPIVVTVTAILATLGLTATIQAAPVEPGRIAAVFPPWWTQSQVIAAGATAGDILGVGGAPFIIILRGDPKMLASRARAAGAMVVLRSDPAGFCSPLTTESKS